MCFGSARLPAHRCPPALGWFPSPSRCRAQASHGGSRGSDTRQPVSDPCMGSQNSLPLKGRGCHAGHRFPCSHGMVWLEEGTFPSLHPSRSAVLRLNLMAQECHGLAVIRPSVATLEGLSPLYLWAHLESRLFCSSVIVSSGNRFGIAHGRQSCNKSARRD